MPNSQAPDFWTFAQQVAFYTSDRDKAFNQLKADWQRQNPGASHTDHEAAMKRLAEVLGI